MLPVHFKLEDAIRPNILALPPYCTSTSDEYGARASILLDANENALGSPFRTSVSCYRDGSVFSQETLDGAAIQPDGVTHVSLLLDDDKIDAVSHASSGSETASSADSPSKALGASHADGASSYTSLSTLPDSLLDDELLATLHRYPSVAQSELKRRITEWKGVSDTSSICLGVGAADLIDATIRLTCPPGRSAILTAPPTFGLYSVRAQLNDVAVITCPLQLANDDFILPLPALLQHLTTNPSIRLILLANPGNPTGTLLPLATLRAILSSPVFTGLLVVDEAYIDFADTPGHATALSLLPKFANLLVLQTTSKTLGLAGLRLGMAFGHPAVMQQLQKVQMPYGISSTTAFVALRALSSTYASRRAQQLCQTRKNRTALLRSLTMLREHGTPIGAPLGGGAGNFVTLPILARGARDGTWRRDQGRAEDVVQALRREHGIAVRGLGRGEGGGCEGCVRVSVGTPWENAVFMGALAAVLGGAESTGA